MGRDQKISDVRSSPTLTTLSAYLSQLYTASDLRRYTSQQPEIAINGFSYKCPIPQAFASVVAIEKPVASWSHPGELPPASSSHVGGVES